MKKLLLASNGGFLIEHGYQLLGLRPKDLRIAWITTASKGVDDLTYLTKHKEAMIKRGLHFEEIDIEQVSDFVSVFAGKNVIHVEGGNAFYLLKAIRETGFDKVLLKWIEEGKPYVGSSAGAYIMCPTIEMATWGPKKKDIYGQTDLTALNQIPFLLQAHYTDEEAGLVQEKVQTASYPVRILRDGQGLLVEGDTVSFVGEGTEVVL